VSFQSGGDMCLGFFQTYWEQGLLPEIPQHGRVLEIGCAEADWLTPMKAARPDLTLVGIDQREPGNRPGADQIVVADVMTFQGFEPASFDAIIAVSMVEWAGTGKYNSPVDARGDYKTLAQARTWLKPTGWLYFDVPYTNAEFPVEQRRHNPEMRIYSDASFAELFAQTGWRIESRQFFDGWMNEQQRHPDGPYMAHVLRPQ
jgi:SAM-dependent methyltransferase